MRVKKHDAFSGWFSSKQWVERVLTFDPSWYLICMGTGIVVQLLASNFPYPAGWLRVIGYIFWIVDVCLFVFFTAMSLARALLFPKVAVSVLEDLQQTCFLGTIPIAWETIGTGLLIFYSSHEAAAYVAEVFFWIAVAMTLLVTCGGVYTLYHKQGQHKLEDVTGAWLLLFIPMIVGAAFGSNLVNALQHRNSVAVLVVSFLMLSLGLGMSFLLLGIYLWRLFSCQLPPRALIVSTFVPVGPVAMGAYSWVNLSVALARYISIERFAFAQSWEAPVEPVDENIISEMVIWIGIIGGLFLLGVATFWLIEAIVAVLVCGLNSFNIALWSFVFPCGVYANAFCRISNLLRNDGMKGWAAFWVAVTVCLWIVLAGLTTYKAVWQGKLFFAPGVQGQVEKEEFHRIPKHDHPTRSIETQQHCKQTPSTKDIIQRRANRDGTYTTAEGKQSSGQV